MSRNRTSSGFYEELKTCLLHRMGVNTRFLLKNEKSLSVLEHLVGRSMRVESCHRIKRARVSTKKGLSVSALGLSEQSFGTRAPCRKDGGQVVKNSHGLDG